MIIVFDKLFTECIHDPILHNRCRENKLRSLLPNLLNGFAEYNDLTFKEINRQRNCHFAGYGTQSKIVAFFKKYAKSSEVKLFVSNANLYQIAIPDTEIRLIGDLRRGYFHSREKAYDDLFSVLFIDFDNSLHKNVRKLRTKQQHNLICVMKERDCLV
jgi:hypothetical protein